MLLVKLFNAVFVGYYFFVRRAEQYAFFNHLHICYITIFASISYFLFFLFWSHCNLTHFIPVAGFLHICFLFIIIVIFKFVCVELISVNYTLFNLILYYLLWVCVGTYWFCMTSSLIIFFFIYESIQFSAIYILFSFTKTQRALHTALLMGFWTLIGALFLLIAFHCLIIDSEIYTFVDYECHTISLRFQTQFYLCLFIGFGVKLPIWPATSWLLQAHVEAPTFWSIFLSGAYIKYPAFGLIFFFKTALGFYIIILLSVLFCQLIHALCTLIGQSDLKQIVAAITICEMQLNLIFLLLLSVCGFWYWMYFFLAHAINTSFGFWLVDEIAKLFNTREISQISGLSFENKELSRYICIYLLCVGGFPGTLVFWLELFFLMSCLALSGLHAFLIILLFNLCIISIFFAKWHALLFGQPIRTTLNFITVDTFFKYRVCILFNFFFIFFI